MHARGTSTRTTRHMSSLVQILPGTIVLERGFRHLLPDGICAIRFSIGGISRHWRRLDSGHHSFNRTQRRKHPSTQHTRCARPTEDDSSSLIVRMRSSPSQNISSNACASPIHVANKSKTVPQYGQVKSSILTYDAHGLQLLPPKTNKEEVPQRFLKPNKKLRRILEPRLKSTHISNLPNPPLL
eukprot:6489101-Amphidinium_carterae.1